MKLFTLILTITFFPSLTFAEDLDNQINKACLRHSVSLITKLETNVIGNLSQEKSDHALKLANDSCQAYFKKEFSQNSEELTTVSNKANEEDSEETDWFSENILNGEPSEKDGNKRLRRRK